MERATSWTPPIQVVAPFTETGAGDDFFVEHWAPSEKSHHV
jgi:hypothetical protein